MKKGSTINGTKVSGLKWSRLIGAFIGTVHEPGWGAGSTFNTVNMWNKAGIQLGIYGTMRPGYNLNMN